MEVGGENIGGCPVRDNGGLDWVLSNGDVEKRTDPGNTLEVGLREPAGNEAK